jgi:hypothetical protein
MSNKDDRIHPLVPNKMGQRPNCAIHSAIHQLLCCKKASIIIKCYCDLLSAFNLMSTLISRPGIKESQE